MSSATLRLLQNAPIDLPKDLGDSELVPFLRGFYGEFERAIDCLDDGVGEEIRGKRAAISSLCESIIAAVATVSHRGLDSAVALISPGLDAVRTDLLTVARQNEDTILRGQSLYRVRASKGTPLSAPWDLFHLPFELRHLSAAARYSTRDVPCLYLANSIYTCWTECRLPEISKCDRDFLDSVYASRFEFNQQPRLLDFCYPPWALLGALESLEHPAVPELVGLQIMHAPIGPDVVSRVRYLASWLAIWPLLAAVSLRTAGEADRAQPEYLVPQMLMAWVQGSQSFDGIRYFSTREPAGPEMNHYAIDYAFPARTSRLTGHCKELERLFLCTEPVGFGRVAGADLKKLLSAKHFALAESKFRRCMIRNDHEIWPYFETTYCDMEYALDYCQLYTLVHGVDDDDE
jgi:hypothetical protein